ncbi:MAG: carbon starvation CstA family protein [Polyangiaceae bacterium]
MLPLLALSVVVVLTLGYVFYGRFIGRIYALDDGVTTPAVRKEDGEDFVPTKPFYLLGQHFSAIAAAGPIAGPILAVPMFGWAPCVLSIVRGVVFIGAVHDFSALVASVRHDAESVAELAKRHIGRRAWLMTMAFIWLALVYVLVAFADITASTFVGKTEELAAGPDGQALPFNAGGAVAMASILYLGLAVVMGLVDRRWKPPLWLTTVIFVPATLAAVWLGTRLSTVFVLPVDNPQRLWGLIILAYCFVASLLPVWMLLQPRGYLGGFVLYIAIAVGVIGIFFGGLRFPGEFEIRQPAFKSLDAGGPFGTLFPFLFVTIACGACSGFHGLVCSGTTSKQIAKESHTRAVGYGAMLLEAFVAIIALGTVVILAEGKLPGPGKIYGDGIGKFLTVIIGRENLVFAATFGAMAFSTFVFDTIDVSTRLGRYVIQELFDWRGRTAAAAATAITLVLPALFIASARAPQPGVRPAYMDFWTLFGTSNQLLAALTLLAVTVWLHREKRRIWYTAVPAAFVMVITLWALAIQIWQAFATVRANGLHLDAAFFNGVVCVLLVGLAVSIVVEALRVLHDPGRAPSVEPLKVV